MTPVVWLMILLVVAILAGPFLALKAVTKIRSRRSAPSQKSDDGS